MLDAIARMVALESGRIKLETAPFNFRAFMSKTVTPFVRRAEEKGLRMRVTISKTKPARVRCDEAVVAKPSQQCDQVYQTGRSRRRSRPGFHTGMSFQSTQDKRHNTLPWKRLLSFFRGTRYRHRHSSRKTRGHFHENQQSSIALPDR
jgi:hypothetical protein